jgi:hypothetical protein
MTNKTMIENLNRLIAGDIIERYYGSHCDECEEAVFTAEAKRRAAEHKATAARIAVALTATDNPSAWAVETKGTVYDSPMAAVIRGELENTSDVTMNWVLDRMRNRQPFFTGQETVPMGESRDGWQKTRSDYKAERLKRGEHRPHHAECLNRPEAA